MLYTKRSLGGRYHVIYALLSSRTVRDRRNYSTKANTVYRFKVGDTNDSGAALAQCARVSTRGMRAWTPRVASGPETWECVR